MLKPLSNRVILKVAEKEETTASGFVLPDSVKDTPQTGEVVAVGNGVLLPDGSRAEMDVQVGNQVIFEKQAGSEVKYNGQEYLVLKDTDIIAIVE